jgi:hypothetical protein
LLKRLTFIEAHKYTSIFTIICLLISLPLILISRWNAGFAQWYAVNLYPAAADTVSRLFSAWNFSFFEAGILSLTLLFIALALAGLLMLIFRSRLRKPYGSFCLRFILCVMSGLLLIYSFTAVNYQREGIGAVMNLPAAYISKDKLEKLSVLLADDLTQLTGDPEFDYSMITVYDQAYVETEAFDAMKDLGKKEPSLSGYHPKPKPVYFSDFLSGLGIEGIFSPFTMEANYNDKMTSFLIPYTICHELAHLKGYMKEDDAGFIAFMASINSPSKVFQYSGLFHGLIFTLNALKHEVSTEEFNRIYQKLPEPVRIQLSYIKEQNQVNSSFFTVLTGRINNLYLMANAQAGTKSYGRMVDLLIAEYADRINSENLT